MTLQQALREAQKKDIWLRPVAARGTGIGYLIKSGWICRPTHRGAQPASFPLLDDVLGEWETVHPDHVNNEYHAHTETP